LERWLGESGKNSCEICGYEYVTKRKPKYTGCTSIFHWLRNPLSPADVRNVVFDMACFCILTPLAAVSAWLCVLGAQHYTFGQDQRRLQIKSQRQQPDEMSQRGERNHNIRYPEQATNSTWTSVGLLTLTGTLLSAYIVWLIVAFRFHLQVFRDWQNKNFIVTIVPMSTEEQAIANETRNTEIAILRSSINNRQLEQHLLRRHITVHDQKNENPEIESEMNSNINQIDMESTSESAINSTSTSSEEISSAVSTPPPVSGVESSGEESIDVEIEFVELDHDPSRTNSAPN